MHFSTTFISVAVAVTASFDLAMADGHGHDHSTTEKITWTSITDLPSARSDFTATVAPVNGKDFIYIIGGCAADQGKSPYGDWYACPTITNICDKYDPVADTYTSCAPAPQNRYRHAAVEIDGKVWLVGGVDANDAAVKDVEVYDPVTNSWSVYGTWGGATTDLAAFAVGTDLFMVGGYNATNFLFHAQSAVWKVDTTATSFDTTQVASMSTARGDIFAAVADEYVYITGGFTHEDYWCAPHASVEKWHIGTSEWSAVPDMNYKRGDKALMHMNQQIYAIGGESKVKTDDCNNQPANASMAVEHVEIYNELTNTWTDATVLPEETFRFVAVAHEPSDSIYIFGGQNYYDASCDCYPVSKKALKFVDSDWTIDNIDAPAATVGARGLGAAAAAALMAAGLMFW
mmetsp:Transcript_17071/g.34194  ORF Transcript_17071/g.34194 Transcript_17071/m.34194 type:complete len:402 (+) Transcript_17071:113-1318(+)